MGVVTRTPHTHRSAVRFSVRSVLVTALVGVALTALAACGERPQDGLDALLVAMQEKDTDAAWQRFDRGSRRMMEDTAAAFLADGQDIGSARDHLMTDFSPRGTERIEVIEREGDRATLRVVDLEGKSEQVMMRYEDGLWRIHLDGAD